MIAKFKNLHLVFAMLGLSLLLNIPAVSYAQRPKHGAGIAHVDKQLPLEQLLQFKHDFLKIHLKITHSQETRFFRIYDQMDAELRKIGEETRTLERKTSRNAKATDTELESAARVLFEQKQKEAEVELKYYEEFKKVLTKSQLFRYKEVERKMIRALLEFTQNTVSKKKD